MMMSFGRVTQTFQIMREPRPQSSHQIAVQHKLAQLPDPLYSSASSSLPSDFHIRSLSCDSMLEARDTICNASLSQTTKRPSDATKAAKFCLLAWAMSSIVGRTWARQPLSKGTSGPVNHCKKVLMIREFTVITHWQLRVSNGRSQTRVGYARRPTSTLRAAAALANGDPVSCEGHTRYWPPFFRKTTPSFSPAPLPIQNFESCC